MHAPPKLTRVPRSSPLVRRSVAAASLGLGTIGLACGGEVIESGNSPLSSPESDASAEAAFADTASSGADAGLDGSSPDVTTTADVTTTPDATTILDVAHDQSDLYDASMSDVLQHLKDHWSSPCGIPPPPK